jgi:hypothetical protein
VDLLRPARRLGTEHEPIGDSPVKRLAPLAALATVMAVGLAPMAQAQVPAGDSVVGEVGHFGEFLFGIDAHSGPYGENPTGTASWHVAGGLGPTTEVTVTCLAVTGKTAVVGYTGTQYWWYTYPVAGLIRTVDGGGRDTGQDSVEIRGLQGPDSGAPIPGPTDCSSYPSTFPPEGKGPPGPRVMPDGDIVITDAPPPAKASFAGSKRIIRVSRRWRFSFTFTAEPGLEGRITLKTVRKVRPRSTGRLRRATFGNKTFTVPASGKVRVKFKLSRRNRLILRRYKKLRLGVTVKLRNSTDLTSTAKTRITLKAPKPRR